MCLELLGKATKLRNSVDIFKKYAKDFCELPYL